jgi:hypothetical protein
MKVRDPNPTEIGHHWMHCPKPIKDPFKSIKSSSASRNNFFAVEKWTAFLFGFAILNFGFYPQIMPS